MIAFYGNVVLFIYSTVRRNAVLSDDLFIHNAVKPPGAMATSPPRLFKRCVKTA